MDSLFIVNRRSTMDAVARNTEHRGSPVEAKVEGDPRVWRGVGKASVHGLPVADRDIARLA